MMTLSWNRKDHILKFPINIIIFMLLMKKLVIISLSSLFLLISGALRAQSRFAVGVNVEPLLCFTSLNPRLDGLERTSPRNWDLFNYKLGVLVDHEFDVGVALTAGMDFSRKRFGYIHEQTIGEEDVLLWGHSEFYSVGIPLRISYTVYTGKDPYIELQPFAGVSIGKDFSSYRNLTRLDENTGYNFILDDYEKISDVATGEIGIKLRTIIDQLGLIDWHLSLGSDITSLPVFSYEIIPVGGEVTRYEQKIKMRYISFGMTYYFTTWEVINGSFMKRRY